LVVVRLALLTDAVVELVVLRSHLLLWLRV
jgi:hypothetical protein